jgi:hypothetical protein
MLNKDFRRASEFAKSDYWIRHVCLCLSVCPMEQLGSHWIHFHGIWYLRIFWKCLENWGLVKSNKNNGYFTWWRLYVYDIISRWIILRTRIVSDRNCGANAKSILGSIFFSENHSFYVAKYGTRTGPQMAI